MFEKVQNLWVKLVFFEKIQFLRTFLLQFGFESKNSNLDLRVKIRIFLYYFVSKILESEYSRFKGKDSNPNPNILLISGRGRGAWCRFWGRSWLHHLHNPEPGAREDQHHGKRGYRGGHQPKARAAFDSGLVEEVVEFLSMAMDQRRHYLDRRSIMARASVAAAEARGVPPNLA